MMVKCSICGTKIKLKPEHSETGIKCESCLMKAEKVKASLQGQRGNKGKTL